MLIVTPALKSLETLKVIATIHFASLWAFHYSSALNLNKDQFMSPAITFTATAVKS